METIISLFRTVFSKDAILNRMDSFYILLHESDFMYILNEKKTKL